MKVCSQCNGLWCLLTYSARLEVIVEAFVMQSSVASLNNLNNEDIVAALQAFSNQYLHGQVQAGEPPTLFNSDTFKLHFLSELYRTIGVRVDYSIDPQLQQLLQSNQGLTLQRCLSIQTALGYAGGGHPPSLWAILAWTILNIRSVVMVSMGTMSRKPGVENELSKPGMPKQTEKMCRKTTYFGSETVHVLIGLVSWSMTLISYIVDELFVLEDYLEDNDDGTGNISLDVLNARSELPHQFPFDQTPTKHHPVRETNSPALLLLLVSSSRNFLKYNCNPLKAFMQACKSQHSQTPLRLAYQELFAVFQKSLVSVSQFERLLSQLDTSIRSAYQASNTSETDRSTLEKNMLIRAEIPPILLPTVHDLLTKTAASLRDEVNVAELYFSNVASLGLTDDNAGKRWRREHPLDAMRKVELGKGVQTRRCTRCAAVMEDLLPTRTTSLMVSQMKHCFCGGWWMVGGEEDGGNGLGY